MFRYNEMVYFSFAACGYFEAYNKKDKFVNLPDYVF